MIWLAAVLAAVAAGVGTGNRWLARRRTLHRIQGARRSLERRAEQAARAVDRARARAGQDPPVETTVDAGLTGALTTRLDQLDHQRATVPTGAEPGAATLGSDQVVAAVKTSAALAADYAGLEEVAGQVGTYLAARQWPHPKLGELLAVRDQAGVATPERPDPPAARHLSRLANEADRLEEAGRELVDTLAEAPIGTPDLAAALDDQIGRYQWLSTATDRAWARMFPARAEAEAEAGRQALDEVHQMQELSRQVGRAADQRDQAVKGRPGPNRASDDSAPGDWIQP